MAVYDQIGSGGIRAGNLDPNYGSVSLLLHMDGANASTTFTDSSTNSLTGTANGNAQISTAQSKFGGASAYFDGVGDYVNLGTNAAWSLGTTWTVEAWIYPTNANSGKPVSTRGSTSGNMWEFFSFYSNAWYIEGYGTNNTGGLKGSGNTYSANQWYHLAAVTDAGVTKLYVNGILDYTYTNSFTWATSYALTIGGSLAYSEWFSGYIDELRITKGVARYTGNFVPGPETVPNNTIFNITPSGGLRCGNLDPNYANVSALLHMEGTNGSTTFTDSSINSLSVTPNYNAKISTSQRKFGLSSLALDGSGDYLSIASNSGFSYGTGDFTIEGYFYFTSIPSAQCLLIDVFVSGGLSLYYVGNTAYFGIPTNTLVLSNRQININSQSWTPTLNTWHHIAATRSGTTVTLWINGSQLGTTATNSSNLAQGALQIGGGLDGTGWTLTGYVDEVRITKGLARYTAGFVPAQETVPTTATYNITASGGALGGSFAKVTPYYEIGSGGIRCGNLDPNYASVSLLMHMNGSNGSSTFLDSTINNYTFTTTGSPVLSSTYSRSGGISGYFDGSSRLTASGTAFDFGSGNYTVEFYVYILSLPSPGYYSDICGQYVGAPSYPTNLHVGVVNFFGGFGAYFYIGQGNAYFSFGTSPSINTWYHVAICKDSSGLYGFINGVYYTTGQTGVATLSPTTSFAIGGNSNGPYFNGYVDEIRVTKGLARYPRSQNFVVALETVPNNTIFNITPSGGLRAGNLDPNYASVSLLMHFDGANASTVLSDSSINNFSITANGNAQISTTQSKFGGSSGYFDGTGDYVKIARTTATDSAFNLGTQDFTVEVYVYFAALPSNSWATLASYGADQTAGNYQRWLLYYDTRTSQGSPGLRFSGVNASNGLLIDFSQGSTSGWSANTWYHVAVTRNGSNFRLFRDGIQLGSTYVNSSSFVDVTSNGFYAGTEVDGSSGPFNGYLDDLRITKGLARYTSNFVAAPETVPTNTVFNITPSGGVRVGNLDPNYGSVIFMLHMDGANGATTFYDSGPSSYPVTTSGNAQISTTLSKSNGSSALFDGNLDYISLTPTTAVGTSDFTMEFWFNPTVYNNVVAPVIIFNGANGDWNANKYGINPYHYYYNQTKFEFFVYNYSPSSAILVSTTSMANNTWFHIAITRSGNTWRLFLNGNLEATNTSSVSVDGSIANTFYIGGTSASANSFYGYIDEFRYTLGVARYTSNFVVAPETVPNNTVFNITVSGGILGGSSANVSKSYPITLSSAGLRAGNLDPNYANVSLWLHMDGANGSTTFNDSSTNSLSVASYGSANLSTSISKFGGASGSFTNSNSYLQISNSSLFNLGASDFTIEGWIYPTLTTGAIITKNQGNYTVGYEWWLGFASNSLQFTFVDASATFYSVTSSSTISQNSWTHFAVVRSGSNVNIYVNGSNQGTTAAQTIRTTTSDVAIARDLENLGGGRYYTGYIDELRFTKGVARYTSNFVPAQETVPNNTVFNITASGGLRAGNLDPNYANVSLLMHFDGANGSTTFTDSSVNNLTSTASGNAQISTTQSKFGGSSGYFDGSGDYITVSTQGDSRFNFGTGDFTIEFWMRPEVFTTNFYADGIYGCGTNGVFIYLTSAKKIGITQYGVAEFFLGSTVFVANNWYHIAFSRTGTTLSLYVNGVLDTSVTNSSNFTAGSKALQIGQDPLITQQQYQGYIDDLRVTKGIGRYTSNFVPAPETVPTSFTYNITASGGLRCGNLDPNYASVVLLLHMNGTNASTSFIDSSTGNLTVTANGNAQISTSQSKFGGSSCYLDGSGDYLEIASNAGFAFGSGDFTVEMYLRFNTLPATQAAFFDIVTSGGFSLYYTTPQYFSVPPNNLVVSNRIVGQYQNTWNISTGVWYHVAVCRSGTDLRVFIDGTQLGSTVTTSTSYVQGTLQIGNQLDGWVDEVRVNKGYARYTAGFVPAQETVPTTVTYNITTSGGILGGSSANAGKLYPITLSSAGLRCGNLDPYYANVSLLLHMDGANGSTTFNDSSINSISITPVGDSKISTAQSKIGGASGYFDGVGDYLTVADNPANAFGVGDFTIDCWVNFSALPGTNQIMGIANTMSSISAATTTMWWFGLENSGGTNRLRLGRHGNALVYAYTNWTPSLNTWYHIAVTRSSSSVISIFINGSSQSVTTSGSNWANDFSATSILAVATGATFLSFNGYLDDFRLTKGLARYTSDFVAAPETVPNNTVFNITPSGGLRAGNLDPNYANVSLLMHFDGTNNSTTFLDSSTNNLSITATGNSIITTTTSKFGGASGYFDGSGDYLTVVPNSQSFNFGTQDMTIECYFRFPSTLTGLYKVLLSNENASWGSGAFTLYADYNNDGRPAFWVYDYSASVALLQCSSGNYRDNTWHHLAIVRKSAGVSTMFIDGVSVATGTHTGQIGSSSRNLVIGSNLVAGRDTEMYLDDLKITNGVAKYTSNFVPAPETVPTNTVFNITASGGLRCGNLDPNYASVVLLLHMNGTNASTTFLDSSIYSQTISAFGTAQISTTQSKFGGSGGYFDGDNDNLTAPANSNFAFGTGDFTIEMWTYSTDSGSSQRCLFDTRVSQSSLTGIMLRENGTGYLVWVNYTAIITTGAVRTLNAWTHLALVRSGTTYTLYVNGVSAGTGTDSTNLTDNNCFVARFVDTGANPYGFQGYLDEVRVTKGLARYSAGFVPAQETVPTTATYNITASGGILGGSSANAGKFYSISLTSAGLRCGNLDTNYANVGLLLHMDGTNGSTTFLDSSPNSFTITNTGSPQISTSQSKFGGASGSFNGSSYVYAPNSSIFSVGTGDFTVECWIYFNSIAATTPICQVDAVGTSFNDKWWFGYFNSGRLGIGQHFTSNNAYCAWAPSTSTWYHVAAQRVSGTISIYINGASQTVTNSTIFSATSFSQNGMAVGALSTPYYLNGYIDDFRFTKGVGRYTSNFVATQETVPNNTVFNITASGGLRAGNLDPNYANVSILLHMDGTNGSTNFVDSSVNNNVLTANGNTQISTSQSKFGGSSVYFDGSGDWLSFPTNSNFNFGSSDFTVEFWYYYSGTPKASGRLFQTASGDVYTGLSICHSNPTPGPTLLFSASTTGTSWDYNAGTSLSAILNTWVHIAVVRQSNVLYCYINGVQNTVFASFTGSLYYNSSDICVIGGQSGTDRSINGYIDDFRITKGVARYTSNFVAAPETIPTNTVFNITASGGLRCGNLDPNYASVSLLLHMDGANGSTTFTDVSTNNTSIVAYGDAKVSTAQSKFGGASAIFDGNGDYLSVARNSTIYEFGTGDFTIEAWVYLTVITDNAIISGIGPTNGNFGLWIRPNGTFDISRTFIARDVTTTALSWSLNTWYHVAVSRSSGTLKIFRNGSQVYSASNTQNYNLCTSADTDFAIGATQSLSGVRATANYFNGYIDEVRVTKGVARYTTDFVAYPETVPATATYNPTPSGGILGGSSAVVSSSSNISITSAGAAVGSTALVSKITTVTPSGGAVTPLLIYRNSLKVHYNVGDTTSYPKTGTSVYDLTGNNFTGTLTNGPTFEDSTYNSFVFDGVNDYVSSGVISGDFTAFTITVLFNASSVLNYRNVIDANRNYYSSGNVGPRLEMNSSGNLVWVLSANTGNANIYDAYNVITSGMSTNTWYNVSITRSSSGLISTYLNGTAVVSNQSNPNGFVNVFNALTFGAGFLTAQSDRYFAGRIADVQVYNRELSSTEILRNYNTFTSTNILNYTTVNETLNPQIVSAGAAVGGTSFQAFNDIIDLTSAGAKLAGSAIVQQNANLTTSGGLRCGNLDPNYANVGLLLHMDGTNGSTAFLDSSLSNNVFTASGSSQISTSQSKFGGASGYFASASLSYISTTTGSFQAFGTGDFTVEAWIYLSDTNANATKGIVGGFGSNSFGFRVGQSFQGNVNGLSIYRDQVADCEYCAYVFSTNTWYHVAVVRSSSTILFFVNGAQQTTLGSGAATFNYPAPTSVRIGCTNPSVEYFNGYIDDLRITKGVARYTSNFVPAQETVPNNTVFNITASGGLRAGNLDPNYANVTLLLHMNGTNASTTFADSSIYSLVGTTYDNAQISTTQSKFGGASGYFDGSGDYLTFASSTLFNFSSNDFTVEAWVYPTALTANPGTIFTTAYPSDSVGIFVGVQSNGYINYLAGSGGSWAFNSSTTSNPLSINTWYHIAFVRSGNVFTVYVNGVPSGSTTNSIVTTNSNNICYVGGRPLYSQYFTGYIDDLRVTNGYARYTSNFVAAPETAPNNTVFNITPSGGLRAGNLDPNYANVSLLLHFDGTNGSTTFTDSSVNNLSVTPYGNAQISNSFSKSGGASGSFLSSGDYCSIPNSSLFDFGSGDFSLEMWLRLADAGGSYRSVVTKDTSTGRSWLVLADFADVLFTIPDGTQVRITNAISSSAWSHIYFGRQGNTMYSALNGQISSVSYNFTIPTTSTNVEIGRQGSWGSFFGGYIDDLRITKGVARYTSNFVPAPETVPVQEINNPQIASAGATLGSSGIVTVVYSNSITSAGVLGGSSAINTEIYNISLTSAGVLGGSSATIVARYNISLASAGVLGGSSATIVARYNISLTSAGVLGGSSASPQQNVNITVSGGLRCGNLDPNYANVSLLLHLDGVNGTTTFPDSSINNLTVTRNGDTIISTTQSKFGGSSAYFDGIGDSLSVSNATLFDFTGNFTIEGWFYFVQVNQYNNYTILFSNDVLASCQFGTAINAIEFYWNGSLLISYPYASSNLLNTWTHLAVTRSGSTFTIWLNGASVATGSSSANIDVSQFWIGQQINNATAYHYFNGYADEIRITKGVSRYSANFVPAPETVPVQEINNPQIVSAGATLGSSAIANVIYNNTPTAGAKVGGSTTNQTVCNLILTSAGVLGGSSALNTEIYNVSLTSAGALLNGSSIQAFSDIVDLTSAGALAGSSALNTEVNNISLTSAGVLGGSSALNTEIYNISLTSAGVLANGLANSNAVYQITPTAGSLVAGSSTNTEYFALEVASFGAKLSGIGYVAFSDVVEIASAGVITNGSAIQTQVNETNIGSAGVLVGGLADNTHNQIASMSNGAILSGSATVSFVYNLEILGGSLVSGSFESSAIYEIIASNGLQSSGSSETYVIYNYNPTNGVLINGTATFVSNLIETMNAGCVVGGYIEIYAIYDIQPSNGVLLSGSIETTFNPIDTMSGGLVLSGNAEISAIYDIQTENGIVLSGTVDSNLIALESMANGVALSGNAEIFAIYDNQTLNGILISGTIDSNLIAIESMANGVALSGYAEIFAIYDNQTFNGILISGTVDSNLIAVESMLNGITISGSLDLFAIYNISFQDGIAAAGESVTNAEYFTETSGGALLNGSVQEAFNPVDFMSGGIAISGESTVFAIYELATFNGIICSGAAQIDVAYNEQSFGGILVNGNADINSILLETMSNGVQINGTSDAAVDYNISSTSSVIVSGFADQTFNSIAEVSGGTLVAGDTEINLFYNITPELGVVINGSATTKVVYLIEPSNGVVVAGNADFYAIFQEASSNGVIISGSSIQETSNVIEASGGTLTAGVSEIFVIYDVQASGGLTASGIGTQIFNDIESMSGGILVNGSAIIDATYEIQIIGGLVAQGIADNTSIYNIFGENGLTLSGSVDQNLISTDTMLNGVQISGESINFAIYEISPTLGAFVSGQADNTVINLIEVSGGCLIQGVPDLSAIYNIAPVGGVIVNGSSSQNNQIEESMSGGVQLNGSISVFAIYEILPLNGVSGSGTSDTTFNDIIEVAGGCLISGAAESTVYYASSISGGTVISGTPDVFGISENISSGGIVLSGEAYQVVVFLETSSGGIVVSGQSESFVIYLISPTNGATTSGQASQELNSLNETSGGAQISGSAFVEVITGLVISGGVVVNGQSFETFSDIIEVFGGALVSGDVIVQGTYVIFPQDGSLVNGTAQYFNNALQLSTGGALVNGSSNIYSDYNYLTSGGSLVNGFVDNQMLFNPDILGGATLGFEANFNVFYNLTPFGGSLVDGQSINEIIAEYISVGGVLINGESFIGLTQFETMQDGALISGESLVNEIIAELFNGGIIVSGESLQTQIFEQITSGGVLVSGGLTTSAYAEIMRGGVTLNGYNYNNYTFVYRMFDGVKIGGTAFDRPILYSVTQYVPRRYEIGDIVYVKIQVNPTQYLKLRILGYRNDQNTWHYRTNHHEYPEYLLISESEFKRIRKTQVKNEIATRYNRFKKAYNEPVLGLQNTIDEIEQSSQVIDNLGNNLFDQEGPL